MAETTITYYELTRSIYAPGLPKFDRGTRKTKEEWMATGHAFKDEDFDWYGRWFTKIVDRVPDYDVCTDIVCRLLDLPSPCTRTALSKLEQLLRADEAKANDVSIAYGLRKAADYLKDYIEQAPVTTKEYVDAMVREAFKKQEKQ